MVKINGAIQKEYPQEQVLRCQAKRNNISRQSNGLLRAGRQQPTLLELASPAPFEFYDVFEVKEFSYSQQDKKGHLEVDISLLKKSENLEITAQILDLKTETVVAELQPQKAENVQTLSLSEAFSVQGNQVSSLAVLAYGKWGDHVPEENQVTIFKEINTLDDGVTYYHEYPKKETEVKRFGNLEGGFTPDPKAKGDKDHIVIALIRSPQDMTDIDYLCGNGRGSRSHPLLCVPGQGILQVPSGETPIISGEYSSSVVCKLYRKSGGAAVIANSDPAYQTNKIELTLGGQSLTYSFWAWGMPYDDPAGWEKTEFDYYLDITLMTQRQDGTYCARTLYIDSRNISSSLTNKVRPLQIMYGCMAPNTEIAMLDGGTKQICDIQIGEKVKGKNGEGMLVENVWTGPEMDQMIEVSVQGLKKPLLLTKNHPVWVQDATHGETWKRAVFCSQGERVLVCDAQGKEEYCEITELKQVEPCETVYNLDLRPCGNHTEAPGTMYCNGILTGDNRMQNSDLEG